jgi:hypothetical protein
LPPCVNQGANRDLVDHEFASFHRIKQAERYIIQRGDSLRQFRERVLSQSAYDAHKTFNRRRPDNSVKKSLGAGEGLNSARLYRMCILVNDMESTARGRRYKHNIMVMTRSDVILEETVV